MKEIGDFIFYNLLVLNTMLAMYKSSYVLPNSIQKLFEMRETNNELRSKCMSEKGK